MGYVVAALLMAFSLRSPRALLAVTATFLVGLYIYVQVELHRVRSEMEQQEKQRQAATARPSTGRE